MAYHANNTELLRNVINYILEGNRRIYNNRLIDLLAMLA